MNTFKTSIFKQNSKLTQIFLIIYITFGILSYFFFDRPLAYFFLNLNLSPTITDVICGINFLGESLLYWGAFPVCIGIAWYWEKKDPKKDFTKKLLFLFVCFALSCLITTVLKITLSRARPHELFEYARYGFFWFQTHSSYWSFPSGHTTTISALMFGLCCLKPQRTLLWIAIALIVSSMRLFLTKHYLSDVMMAFLVSYFCVYCVQALYQKRGYMA